MDERIREVVTETRDAFLDREYTIIEAAHHAVGDPCRFVDIGCGALGLLRRKGSRLADLYPRSLGIDIDHESLAKNRQVMHAVRASCYSLPLRDNSVDILACRWLVEHLEEPEAAIREWSRVLRRGGYLYIKTPNLLNYTMLISKVTPTSFHNLIHSVNAGHDNIPTFYRANTTRVLRQLASKTGFRVVRLECHSYSYMYYMFNKELFLTMRGVSRLVERVTDRVQQTIVCLLQKADDV